MIYMTQLDRLLGTFPEYLTAHMHSWSPINKATKNVCVKMLRNIKAYIHIIQGPKESVTVKSLIMTVMMELVLFQIIDIMGEIFKVQRYQCQNKLCHLIIALDQGPLTVEITVHLKKRDEGWKRPLRSSSPIIILTLPSPPLNHSLSTTSTCLLNTSREGDSTTSLGSLFQGLATLSVKKFFLISNLNFPWRNLRPSPLVLWLVTWEKRPTDTHLITTSFQTLHQLRCPSLDTLQHLNIFLVVRGPKLNTVFEVRPHQYRVQGDNHFSSPSGHTVSATSQDAIGLLGHLGTLLALTKPALCGPRGTRSTPAHYNTLNRMDRHRVIDDHYSPDRERDGDSTTSLGSLFQCFTTLSVKKFFLISNLNLS
ncbi:hypothetical protein QYF61_002372 [Mycteria americana]|uniref:Uncharacterized protein n=1 Tax=Mycteria americana TaxID=33587 RepID=A0AAN7PGI0_MYCAM|nr:hypothetical protein QYF61_002372 [Mycteria americana]